MTVYVLSAKRDIREDGLAKNMTHDLKKFFPLNKTSLLAVKLVIKMIEFLCTVATV